MRLVQRCIAFAIVCFAFVTAAEAACQSGGNALFPDSFDELASSWGSFENYHVEDGKLIIQPPAGYNTSTLNSASLYDDVDVCVEMTVPPPVKKGNCGGIIFWAVDFDNLYTFQVSTDGTAAVWRRQKGKWLTQIQLQDFSAVRKAASQVNELRVTTVGNKAKFFVNGKLFKEFTGQPPAGGSQIGLIGCAPTSVSARVAFDNLVVSGPGGGGAPPVIASGGDADVGSGVSEASCTPSGNVLFKDQFNTLAPSWGSYDNYRVEAGKLVIQPPAGYNTSTLNTASLYDDVNICAEMTVPPPLSQGNCGGIVFWATDFDNYYTFQISTDGTAVVWRRQKGKWLSQVASQDFAAVHKSSQVNVLRVATTGSKAKLFINGKLFKEVDGQPPDGGSQVGLIGCSPSGTAAPVQFDNFLVSGPGAPPPAVADDGAADIPSRVATAGAKCPAPKDPLFSDHFDTLQTSWGAFENYKVDNGEFLITPPAGYNTSALNTTSLYDDIDLCVEMKMRAPLEQGTCGSLLIWAEDYDNYYSFQVMNDGQASFWRRQRGKWLSQIPWQSADGLNTGAGAVNQLRVTTKGGSANLFINGKLFKTVTGQPPSGGQEVGLLACAGEKQAAAVGFDNFVVAAPGAPAVVEEVAANDGGDKTAGDKGDAPVVDKGDVAVVDKGDVTAVDKGDVKAVDKAPEKVVVPEPPAVDVPEAPQGRKVALVIGISAYTAVPALPNPTRDATAIAAELSAMGFDVTHLENLDRSAMGKALLDFEDKATGASVALVYFAGHGIEVNGVNYLVPADAVLAKASSIAYDAISLPSVMAAVDNAQMRIVLLDACRNNPFPMVTANGARAISRGLARVDEKQVPKSTVIVFAAKDGATAADGSGKNSPFAAALLAHLNDPKLEINMLIRRVTDQVETSTGGAQEPFVYANLTSAEVYLARH